MKEFPRYKKYKDSGVEWLGEIPEHWGINRLKRLTKFAYGDSLSSAQRREGKISVYGSNGIVGCHDTANTFDETIIIGRKGSFGKVNHSSKSSFVIDTAYYIDRRCTDCHIKWLYYLLSCINLGSFTKDSAIPGLAREEAYSRMAPLCSQQEQRSIANFLDQKTVEIDDAIDKKKRLIELLNEKKNILINQVVTKGLDPDAQMCDSGVECIGEIPANWIPIRLKVLMKKIEQGWSPQCFNYEAPDGQWGVLKVGCVNGYKFNPHENKILPPRMKPNQDLEIHHEDVLISRANTLELVGSAACVKNPREKLLLCDKLYRVTVDEEKVIPEYFVLILQAQKSREQIESGANGASPSMKNIGQSVIRNLNAGIPPLTEQKEILDYITNFETHLSRAKDLIAKEIESLVDLKASLISEAVTGKIKI